mgnify:CR=1 FL=1
MTAVEVCGDAIRTLVTDVVLVDLVVIEVVEGVVHEFASRTKVVAVGNWHLTNH